MGMFDTVTTRCPECDEEIEFQSKAGACILACYDAERGVPPEIATDIQWEVEICTCGAAIELIPTIPILRIPMRAVISS